jgi:hypothetical protein
MIALSDQPFANAPSTLVRFLPHGDATVKLELDTSSVGPFCHLQRLLALLRSTRMLGEEHHPTRVDLIGRMPSDQFRQVFAARLSVVSTLNRIENHVRILSAVRTSETADARRDSSLDRISLALVSLCHTGRPIWNIRKRSGGNR